MGSDYSNHLTTEGSGSAGWAGDTKRLVDDKMEPTCLRTSQIPTTPVFSPADMAIDIVRRPVRGFVWPLLWHPVQIGSWPLSQVVVAEQRVVASQACPVGYQRRGRWKGPSADFL